MKYLILIITLLIPLTSILGQDLSAQIKDSKTQLPIQYVNIGIVGKNIGTVSDSLGNFQLSLTNAYDIDSIKISIIAYKTINYNIGDLRASEFSNTILMDEKIVQLKEVVISNEKLEPIKLGLKKKYSYPIPLYKGIQTKVVFPQKGYRHEIGTRFTNTKTMSLDSIQLNFAECNLDNFEIRLNVYAIKNEIIKNILTKPIYISLTKEKAINFPVIDLTAYNIELNSDFLITIENYKQLKDGALYFLANFKSKAKPFPTYYRQSSQSNWVELKTKKSKTIGISILAFGHSNETILKQNKKV
ncbi:carboxypeptidase-like regulatory domain-containing protein [Psychroserpens sp. AS72]|uniref:carboxypeptidase-like regulatory domain-containing protein n=1 Tax=Psychroserpens sp. AS72 TaxID=3135775 RepID=UPI003181EFAD